MRAQERAQMRAQERAQMRAQAPTEKAIFDQKGQWFFVTLRGGSEPV